MVQQLAHRNLKSLEVEELLSQLPPAIQQSIPSRLRSQPSLFLAQRLQSMGCQPEAKSVLQLLVEIEPCNTEALYQLALVCNRFDNKLDALNYITRHYEQRMRANGMEPESNTDTLQYLLSTEGFALPPKQIPRAYVENLFDRFSSQFDERLLNKLGYKTPELLFEVFCEVSKNQDSFKSCKRLVDLGCGTGLSGNYFKAICEVLVGVDLSAEMIKKARLTGVYDDLIVSDIETYLRSDTSLIDILIATDVFNYFGDIAALLATCRNRQNPDGLLAFSVEALRAAPDNEHLEFKLASTGRFQHQKQYVSSSAIGVGYQVLSCTEEVLRHEDGNDVNGYLFVLLAI